MKNLKTQPRVFEYLLQYLS